MRLVSYHHGAFQHHFFFDFRRDFVQFLPEVRVACQFFAEFFRRTRPKAFRDVPEANVGALGIGDYDLEARSGFDGVVEILGVFEDFVHVVFQSGSTFGFPHEPEFENVSFAAALNVFIT